MKKSVKSILAILVSLTCSTPTLANYIETKEPSNTGYFEFYEDFSEVENDGRVNYFTGTSNIDDSYNLTNGVKVIANRPDGVTWVTSGKYFANDSGGAANRTYVSNSGLFLRGSGANIANVNLDVSKYFDVSKLTNEKQVFEFTLNSTGRANAVSLFCAERATTNNIAFGYAGSDQVNNLGDVKASRPFVTFQGAQNTIYTPSANYTLNYPMSWVVNVENEKISWVVTDSAKKTWSGSAPFNKAYMEQCEFLAAYTVSGDQWNSLSKFSYKTGNYYSPEMGAPTEAVYTDLLETATLTDDVYELENPSVVHRVEYYNFNGTAFEMSTDGVEWDRFDRAEDAAYDVGGIWKVKNPTGSVSVSNPIKYRWINTCDKKLYKYIRKPSDEVVQRKEGKGVFRVFTDVSTGGSMELEKNKSRFLYVWANDELNTKLLGESNKTDYVQVNNSDAYTSTGKVQIKARKETYSTGPVNVVIKADSDYDIMVKVVGPLTRAIEALTDPSMTAEEKAQIQAEYIASQSIVLDRLNELIAILNVDPDDINAYVALQAFFTDDTASPCVNDLDFVTGSDFKNIDDSYINRILSYGSEYFKASTIEDLETVSDILVQELKVGEFSDLKSEEALKEVLEKYAGELPIDNVYYLSEAYTPAILSEILKNTSTGIKNYEDLVKIINDSTVVAVLRENKNPDNIRELFLDYESTLGYKHGTDDDHFHEILDEDIQTKSLVQSISETYQKDKKSFDSVAQIHDFIEGYTYKPTATPTPRPTAKPSKTGGGGGGGGGGGSYTDPGTRPNVKTEKTEDKPKVKIFKDVETDHWGYEAVKYLNAIGAANGYEDGTFNPEGDITRAEFTTMLLTSLKLKIDLPEDFENPFVDVTKDDWYYDSVLKAYSEGILLGDGAGHAIAQSNITREEMAVLIYRVVEKLDKSLNRESNVAKFVDEDKISAWARTNVLKMSAAGIIKGSNGRFNPQSKASRAEAAQMLYKTVKGFEE